MRRAALRATASAARLVAQRQTAVLRCRGPVLRVSQQRLFSAKRRRGVKLPAESPESGDAGSSVEASGSGSSTAASETRTTPSPSTPAVERVEIASKPSRKKAVGSTIPTAPPSSLQVLAPALLLLVAGGAGYYVSQDEEAMKKVRATVSDLPQPLQQAFGAIGIKPSAAGGTSAADSKSSSDAAAAQKKAAEARAKAEAQQKALRERQEAEAKAVAQRAKEEAERKASAARAKAAEEAAAAAAQKSEEERAATHAALVALVDDANDLSTREEAAALEEASAMAAAAVTEEEAGAQEVGDSDAPSEQGDDAAADSEAEPARRTPAEIASAAVEATSRDAAAMTTEQLADLLRQEMDAAAADDVASLGEEELRRRLLRLSAHAKDQARTEALRTVELVRANEETWKKAMERAVREAEEAAWDRASKALDEKAAGLDRKYQAAVTSAREQLSKQAEAKFSAEADRRVAAAEAAAEAEKQGFLSRVGARAGVVADSVRVLRGDLEGRARYEQQARRVHRLQMAAAALWDGLEQGKSLADEVAALRAASSGDRVVGAALDALPSGAFDRAGMPTRLALQRRFDAAVAEARKAAMVPEEGGLLGHVMGSFFSGLLVGSGSGSAAAGASPGAGTRAAAAAATVTSGSVATGDGSAEGAATAAAAQNTELSRNAQESMLRLDRAEAALRKGRMGEAAAELGHVEGYAGAQVEGVKAAFEERLRAEQGARLVRAHVRALTASMY